MVLEQVYRQSSILEVLREGNTQVTRYFTAIPTKDFITRPPGEWSPADNLDHVIRSVKPLSRAMQLPRFVLRLMFGEGRKPSRSFVAIRDAYLHQLAQGAQATGRYIPDFREPPGDVDAYRHLILQRWERAGQELVGALSTWRDADLDRCVLPHPILDKLTVREMLFFTLYHNWRHGTHGSD
jgi:hypothetical protein